MVGDNSRDMILARVATVFRLLKQKQKIDTSNHFYWTLQKLVRSLLWGGATANTDWNINQPLIEHAWMTY